jgi:hypothetical protein
MAASRVGLLFSSPITSVTSSTTIAGATTSAVAAGDTAFFYMGARGGTTTAQFVALSGLPGDAVFEGNTSGDIGTLQTSNAGSPANAVIRVYFPTGMSSGTTITGTWLQSATRKHMQAVVWTSVANSNNQGHQVSTGSGGTSLGAGTTGATTTTTGVHIAGWALNSTVSTCTFTPGADTEATMTQQLNQIVGASTFQYGFGEDNTVTAAHAGGETALMNVTAGTVATWTSVQGIWDGAVAAKSPAPLRRDRPAINMLLRM